MGKKESFLLMRWKSLGYALNGVWILLKKETSIQIQIVIAILITTAGFYFNISANEWMIQTLVIALVLCAEGINTAIEKLADFIHPDHHPKIGAIKDIAAAAVLFTALAALIIAAIIYIPKF